MTRCAECGSPGEHRLGCRLVKDREFVAALQKADLLELLRVARNHSAANAKEWKRVAIERELTRRGEVWP